jgi:hypothetical protein
MLLQRDVPTAPPAVPASVVAVFGGGLGFFSGAFVGGMLAPCLAEYVIVECPVPLAMGVMGEALGVALGAHLGNRRRGRFGSTLLASGAVAAAGVTVTAAVSNEPVGGWILLSTFVAQVAAAVITEVLTSPP